MLYVYPVTGSLLTSPAPPLLIRLTTQQTDWQYSYYAKNIKGCLSSEIIYMEHDTLIGVRFSTVLKILYRHTIRFYKVTLIIVIIACLSLY